MSDNPDPLNQLWQLQDVEKPDLNALSKTWRSMKVKQKLYASLDIIGLMVPIVVLIFYTEKLDPVTFFYFVSLTLICFPFITYVLWLRRFSMGWSNTNTDRHIQNLKRQVKSNIRIAFLTKHSCWITLITIPLYFGGLFYYDVFPVDRLIRKSLVSVGILVVMLPGFWIWASRREQRFKNELAQLDKLFSS